MMNIFPPILKFHRLVLCILTSLDNNLKVMSIAEDIFHKYLISLFLSNPPLFHCKQTAAELIRLADFLKLYLCNHVEYKIGHIRWIFTERLEAN